MTDDDGQWPPPPVVFGGRDGDGTGVRSGSESAVERDDTLPPPFVAPGLGRPPVPAAGPPADAGMSLPADALILPDDPIRPPDPDAELDGELAAEPAPDPGAVQELEEQVFPLLEEPEGEPEQEPGHRAEGDPWEEPFEDGTPEAAFPVPADPTAPSQDHSQDSRQDPAEEVAALLEQMAGELRGAGGIRVHADEESSRLEGLLRGVLAGYLAHREQEGG